MHISVPKWGIVEYGTGVLCGIYLFILPLNTASQTSQSWFNDTWILNFTTTKILPWLIIRTYSRQVRVAHLCLTCDRQVQTHDTNDITANFIASYTEQITKTFVIRQGDMTCESSDTRQYLTVSLHHCYFWCWFTSSLSRHTPYKNMMMLHLLIFYMSYYTRPLCVNMYKLSCKISQIVISWYSTQDI